MQGQLASLIRILGSCEIDIERVRHEIVDAAGPHLDKAFYMIEKTGNGYITAVNLTEFLRENEVEATENEALMVIDQYDLSGLGDLSLQDFNRAIKPQDRNINKLGTRINFKEQNLREALIRFLTKELQLLRRVLRQRSMFEAKRWTSFDSYKCFDVKGNGSFEYEDFDAFLQRNNVILPHIDIRAAFRRVDKNRNGSVTFKELSETLFNETHLSQISETCCTGKVIFPKPSKIASPEKPKEETEIKPQKVSAEAPSADVERNSFATTYHTSFKSPLEITAKYSANRNFLSSQRLHSPLIYDVQPYSNPATRFPTRTDHTYDNVDYRFSYHSQSRSVATPSPTQLLKEKKSRPVNTYEYYAPSFYDTQGTVERPAQAYPAPKYHPGFLRNRSFNRHIQTHLPISHYVHRPLNSDCDLNRKYSLYSKKPSASLKDYTIGLRNYQTPRKEESPIKAPTPVEKMATEPFDRPATTLNAGSPAKKIEVLGHPQGPYSLPSSHSFYNGRELYFIKDDRGAYNYHSPRKYRNAVDGSDQTTFNLSPSTRRLEYSRNSSPMKVTTVTRLYNPSEHEMRQESMPGGFYHKQE